MTCNIKFLLYKRIEGGFVNDGLWYNGAALTSLAFLNIVSEINGCLKTQLVTIKAISLNIDKIKFVRNLLQYT